MLLKTQKNKKKVIFLNTIIQSNFKIIKRLFSNKSKNNKIIKKEENEEDKKIQSKIMMLTYEHLPIEYLKDDLFDVKKEFIEVLIQAFKSINKNIVEWIVARELHEDGYPHIHAFVVLDSRLNRKKDFFTIDFKNKTYVANYRLVTNKKSYDNLFGYPLKGTDFITNISNLNLEKKRKMTPSEILFMRSKQIGIYKALTEYKDENPDLAMKNFSSMHNNLMKMQSIEEKAKRINTVTVELENSGAMEHEEIKPRLLLLMAYANKTTKSGIREMPDSVLVGDPGGGKSTLATSISKRVSNNNYGEATSFEDIPAVLQPDHDALVIHESNLHNKYPENEIKAQVHQGSLNSTIRLLFQQKAFKQGLFKACSAVELERHLGPNPDLQLLRRIIIFPIFPNLISDWNDPIVTEDNKLKIPQEIQNEVNKIHYQFNSEIIKLNCIAILKYFKNINLPKEQLERAGFDIKDLERQANLLN